MSIPSLFDIDLNGLPASAGEPAYRRTQLAEWLYAKGAWSFDAMTNLPAAWRRELAGSFRIDPFDAVDPRR